MPETAPCRTRWWQADKQTATTTPSTNTIREHRPTGVATVVRRVAPRSSIRSTSACRSPAHAYCSPWSYSPFTFCAAARRSRSAPTTIRPTWRDSRARRQVAPSRLWRGRKFTSAATDRLRAAKRSCSWRHSNESRVCSVCVCACVRACVRAVVRCSAGDVDRVIQWRARRLATQSPSRKLCQCIVRGHRRAALPSIFRERSTLFAGIVRRCTARWRHTDRISEARMSEYRRLPTPIDRCSTIVQNWNAERRDCFADSSPQFVLFMWTELYSTQPGLG